MIQIIFKDEDEDVKNSALVIKLWRYQNNLFHHQLVTPVRAGIAIVIGWLAFSVQQQYKCYTQVPISPYSTTTQAETSADIIRDL